MYFPSLNAFAAKDNRAGGLRQGKEARKSEEFRARVK
jgi:hypothetical protein